MFTRFLGRSVMGALVLGAAAAATPAAAQTWTGGYIGGHVGTLNGFGTDGTYCVQEEGESTSGSYTVERPAFWLGTWPGGLVYEGMDCWDTLGAGTLEGNAPYAWYWTELYDGLEDLRGHLIGAQLGLRVQAGTGAFAPVFGLEVAHSVLHVRDTIAGGWGLGYFGTESALAYSSECNTMAYGLCGFWVDWQGIFTLDQLTTATFSMGFGTPNVLFYGEFGVAIGRASFSNGTGFNGTGTGFGPVWGGGVEVRLTPRLSIFGEFNRVRLNDIQMLGTNTAYGQAFPMLLDVNVHANIIKVGFNIALGGP